jgi:hypothetical protein
MTAARCASCVVQHDESMHHRRRYTERELSDSLRDSGWEPQIRTYFFTALLPGVAAVRALRRLRPADTPRSDMSFSPPVVSRLLELPSAAEAKLIERGVRLPAGVSIGMVGIAG